MLRRMLLVPICCALVLVAVAVRAAEPGSPWERGSVSAGFFATSSSTDLQVNPSQLGVGVVVDLENLLGVTSGNFTYRIDASFHIGPKGRHGWDINYFDFNRNGGKVLKEDLEIGDEFFPAGEFVDTEFDLRFIAGQYTYAFLQDDRVRVSVGGGLYTLGIALDVSAPDFGVFENTRFTAPLPVIALRGDFILTKSWQLHVNSNLFYVKYQEFSGSLKDSTIGIEYLPLRHWSFGLGLSSVALKLEGEGGGQIDIDGKVELDFGGAALGVKYRW